MESNDKLAKKLSKPLHELYNENEKKTNKHLAIYEQAQKEIEIEILHMYQKVNQPNPMMSDLYHLGHLEALEKQINSVITSLRESETSYITQIAKQAVKRGLSITANELEITFSMLNEKAINQIIKEPWSGANFSKRIWKNTSELEFALNESLTNGIIQGRSVTDITKDIAKRMDVSVEQSRALVRTEYMHALNEGQKEGYKKAGIEEVDWYTTDDERTCKVCGKLHKKRFDIEEAPPCPGHTNCRCTYIPVIKI
ncbi:minor capsid protein [Listeria seeligeri]|uniref:minor capsid protein n=1 Tax=Listeria seeligeri TaxID=1640 RepID=UPI0001C4EC79|nr:minor capsid protein [Listeria seeligeri]CBH27761.1 phage minor head protein, putative [Listeria seeligeri serovar 1/2b str. SLCC3954]